LPCSLAPLVLLLTLLYDTSMIRKSLATIALLALLISGSAPADRAWNDPRHTGNGNENSRYSPYSGPPKTLDPARSYSADEARFIGQIYEPPLQYNYLKRPYELEPLTAATMPTVEYLDKNKKHLSKYAPDNKVAYTLYTIQLKPSIRYQPHPAFSNPPPDVETLPKRMTNLQAFSFMDSRELTADDYVYQIKRLASPKVNSPIYGIMSEHIVGLRALHDNLVNAHAKNPKGYLNLNAFNLTGVTSLSDHRFSILIKGKYPQFIYWLAMPFFSPAPWEADAFYSQPGMKERNLTWDWFPIGTGPYMMTINNPNQKIVLKKNPNFRGEKSPSTHEKMPFIDTAVYLLDKESIPRWNKFLQGYYDNSGISADSFDQAIQIAPNGKPVLTDELKKLGLRLQVAVSPSIFYIGFNMLDPIVGQKSMRARLLRQAISIAIDYEEYIALFRNGRGKVAQGPIPPGIFGYKEQKSKKPSLAHAKRLMKRAGYANGIDPKTHRPLILNFDTTSTGSPEDKTYFLWLRRQLAKIGISLNIQSTLYNRFRDKVRTGQAQLFSWGWTADYPDPENFLFLLYGKNGKVKYGGENATNYNNKTADRLFERIRFLPNGPKRQKKINQLLTILRYDAPMVWGFHPVDYTLSHGWNKNNVSHAVAQNTLKYQKIDAKLRQKRVRELNQPTTWPFIAALVFILVLGAPAIIFYRRKSRQSQIKRY
jgi:oligopeptide transport system substrate-binding protein